MKFIKRCLSIILSVLFIVNILKPLNHEYTFASSIKEHMLTEQDVEEFVDDLVPTQLKEYNIAGASIAVVKDGEIIFTKGYGSIDVEEKLKADSNTLFRVGSITKLFTWTALMQLIEQGKIDLDTDITTYIEDIKIPDNYVEPITVRNLMTHTAGFEDKFSNLFMSKDRKTISIKEFLTNDKRKRIFAPGEMIAYSNYGALLAGCIIEEVAGMKYEEYIEENILNPLSMSRTTFYQPASEKFGNVSKAHWYSDGKYRKYEDAFTNYIPAGAMSTSANDISKFMIMHLESGRYDNKVVLEEETANMMHSRQYASDERLPGICFGFMEWKRNNKRIIWHSGGTAFFKSLLMLIPDENVGVFISYNSPNSDKARSEFRQQFLNRYYPIEYETFKPLKGYKERVHRYEGFYKEGRTAVSNSDKLIYALSRFEKTTANEDGTLAFKDTKYIEIEPLVFHELNGQGKLIFHEDKKGNIKYLFQDFEPHEGYIKISWHQNPYYHMIVFCFCMIIFILTLITRMKKLLFNEKNNTAYELRKIENLSLLICSLNLLFPIGAALGLWIEIMLNQRVLFTGAVPLLFKISLFPPVVSSVLTIITIAYLVKLVKNRNCSSYKIVYYSIVMFSSLVFICWMYYWNILGFFR